MKLENKKEIKDIKERNRIESRKEHQALYQEGFVRTNIVLPIEEKFKIDQEYERSNSYKELQDKKIEHRWNKKNSQLKRIGDYFYKKLYDFPDVALHEVSVTLNIKVYSIKVAIKDLNFYSKYPLTIIPVPNKAGYVQSIYYNESDSNKWERKKFRTIETMSQIKDKGEFLMNKRFKTKKVVNKPMVIVQKDKNEN